MKLQRVIRFTLFLAAQALLLGGVAYVTEECVSIAVNDKSYVSPNLNRIGYGEALQSVAPGDVVGDKQTITINRNHGLSEWFVNGPYGLEHGFTLNEPPQSAIRNPQSAIPLRLALQVSEGWRAVASDDGKLVTLRGPNDEAVEYGKLVARDKLERSIPARVAVAFAVALSGDALLVGAPGDAVGANTSRGSVYAYSHWRSQG
ncbi:MAG: hypothetical protein JMDDDDMK_05635 [Acidobacteria bacterium]|nr:hypothetical protein [Acidobacteriota bacterium]